MGMHFEICTFYHLIYTCIKFKRSHVLNIYFVSLFVCLLVLRFVFSVLVSYYAMQINALPI